MKKHEQLERLERARLIKKSGGIDQAIKADKIQACVDISLSETVVLCLIRQGVHNFIGIFGHGVTDIGEVLRIYEKADLVKTYPVRHETEAVHAATALRWVTGEKAAVFTSIGTGALFSSPFHEYTAGCYTWL